MFKRLLFNAICAGFLAGGAHAAGCALEGGEPIAEIEELHQLLLDQEYPVFAERIQALTNVSAGEGMQNVANAFPGGFQGCTTILQRRDVGGMVQSFVVFYSASGPLFVYWWSATINGEFKVFNFYLNNEPSKVLERMR